MSESVNMDQLQGQFDSMFDPKGAKSRSEYQGADYDKYLAGVRQVEQRQQCGEGNDHESN
jgi:hypothetical protein